MPYFLTILCLFADYEYDYYGGGGGYNDYPSGGYGDAPYYDDFYDVPPFQDYGYDYGYERPYPSRPPPPERVGFVLYLALWLV